MKIVIPKQELLSAVNTVKSIVSQKSALPILSHILMEADKDTTKTDCHRFESIHCVCGGLHCRGQWCLNRFVAASLHDPG
jgi:hypothetical protein